MPPVDNVLRCPACRKAYRVRNRAADKPAVCPACGLSLEPAASPPVEPALRLKDEPEVPREIPVRLGRYRIDGEIARGGMGVVYKGRQEGLDRVVAIKMLLGGAHATPEMRQRFHREARAAARLRHPGIVPIHEVGEYNGLPFFSMDYIEGKSLEDLLAEGPMPFETGARILRDTARAVQHAHDEGILHRDLKPGNILLDRAGNPHVTDFGLAKDIGSRSMLSVTGDVMGTPAFMSPEQAMGNVHDVDFRTDVYALGAILYRMLTGKPPFEGPTIAATLLKVVNDYTAEPTRLNAAAPPELSAICMKALEKEKKDRYASAAAFADDLDRYLQGEPVTAKPLPAWACLRRALRRQRHVVIAAGSVAAAALAALAAILLLTGRSELDLIESNLAKPALRLAALGALLDGLETFDERDRALALARAAVAAGRDEASRERAYARPSAALADAYASHLSIPTPERLRLRLVRILADLRHRPAVPQMLGLLGSSSPAERLEAVRFFRAVPDLRAFQPLGALVADRACGTEAREAIKALYVERVITPFNAAAGGTSQAIAALGEAMAARQREAESIVGPSAAREGPRDPLEAVAARLRTGDVRTRMQAAWELGLTKDPRAREPLARALADPDDGVARMAAAALGDVGAAGERDRLVAQLRHERAGVRRNAAYLLGRIGDASIRPDLEAAYRDEQDREVRYAMEDALVTLR